MENLFKRKLRVRERWLAELLFGHIKADKFTMNLGGNGSTPDVKTLLL